MRATLSIPDELIFKVQKITHEKSKEKKREELLALKGKIAINYNWEKEEKQELEAQEKQSFFRYYY